MKVLHLIGGGDTGGAKTHVLNLLQELRQRIEVLLVCFRREEFAEAAEEMGIPIHVIESGDPRVGINELKKLLSGQKIDIIHCHGARGNLMGVMIKKHLNAPMVTTVHSDYRLDYLGRPLARLSYGTTNMLALRKSDFYIGVSDTMTDLLIDRNFPPDKIYTIYNGIDFKTPLFHTSRQAFFNSIGFSFEEGDVVAGIAARLSPVKDYPTLLKALKLASDQNPRLKLVIAGDGEERAKLKELTKQLGLEDRVCFAGWVTDMNSFYHALDINLLTSLSETFPYALTEGARAKLPTIASRVGGVPMLIDEGQNGFIFPPGDEVRLAEYLSILAADSALRKNMGEQLCQKASRLFSIDSMVERQLEIYRNITERRCRHRLQKRDGAIICGAYGHGNTGDEAILLSLLHALREYDPNIPITIVAKNQKVLQKKYRVPAIHIFNFWRLLRVLSHSRIFISGGGTLLQNATSHRSLWYYLSTLWLAKRCHNKVALYGSGIGPITGKMDGRLVSSVLNRCVDSITLREKVSMEELKKFGVSRPAIELSSDPALMLAPLSQEEAEQWMAHHGISPTERYLCLIYRHWHGFSAKAPELAAAADYACDTYGLKPLFLCLSAEQDAAAARKVISHMKHEPLLVEEQLPANLLLPLLSHMTVCVSMRLHGLIFSSLSGLPLIGISYDPKIDSFLSYLGYGQCISLAEVDEDKMRAALDTAMSQCSSRDLHQQCVQRLKVLEKKNLGAIVRLLSEK